MLFLSVVFELFPIFLTLEWFDQPGFKILLVFEKSFVCGVTWWGCCWIQATQCVLKEQSTILTVPPINNNNFIREALFKISNKVFYNKQYKTHKKY